MSLNLRFEPSDPPLPNVFALYDPDFEELLGIDPRGLYREGEVGLWIAPPPSRQDQMHVPELVPQVALFEGRAVGNL
jgi:hypothetical protein